MGVHEPETPCFAYGLLVCPLVGVVLKDDKSSVKVADFNDSS